MVKGRESGSDQDQHSPRHRVGRRNETSQENVRPRSPRFALETDRLPLLLFEQSVFAHFFVEAHSADPQHARGFGSAVVVRP